MERLLADDPANAEVIYPYIGWAEVATQPGVTRITVTSINFGDRGEEECRRRWPELMAIVESTR